ncbi:sensor histidine kinase [Kribbella antibiotica]|uniref:sensor histidine kinase n=1 Tax=Kribbella antibiotica TaxID=190195 RepID=UPI00192D6FEE|nr:HAMP domain-containing sensor histidine kinase [Kribbella antibiotica]
MSSPGLVTWRPRLTVRLRLTLSYAGLLVVAGGVMACILWLVFRIVPNYPFIAANPRDERPAPTRGEILDLTVKLSAYAIGFLAIVGLVGGWFLAGRMLKPLQEITAAAQRASTGALDHRIGLTGIRDEFTDLSDTFDAMLDRLQASFEQYRRFAANASHELRTPHAVMKTMLDVAQADPDHQDVPELVKRLAETNQRGIDIVEALLSLAALNNREVELDPVDLAAITRTALPVLTSEARAAGITVETTLAESVVEGSEILLHQLVTNLVQNAIRHNVGPGGSVAVTLTPGQLVVQNTGPLLDPAQVRTFIEPFAKDRYGAGHGLGLALVARIIETHRGTLDLTANPEGGLTAAVTLPTAQLLD